MEPVDSSRLTEFCGSQALELHSLVGQAEGPEPTMAALGLPDSGRGGGANRPGALVDRVKTRHPRDYWVVRSCQVLIVLTPQWTIDPPRVGPENLDEPAAKRQRTGAQPEDH